MVGEGLFGGGEINLRVRDEDSTTFIKGWRGALEGEPAGKGRTGSEE